MGWLPSSLWSTGPVSTPAADTASASSNADACPVDHKSRQAWLDQAKKQSQSESTSAVDTSSSSTSADACPVDDKARQIWLDQAKKQSQPQTTQHSSQNTSKTSSSSPLLPPPGESCDSSQIAASNTDTPAVRAALKRYALASEREISTIPRVSFIPENPGNSTSSPTSAASHGSAAPANNESESGVSSSGNWIYPSEAMFFEAMRRKNFSPEVADMKTIVPIHNAVNERAWAEIKTWEAGRGSEKCGGPKLVSFSGQSTALTPKARFNMLLGYAAPFDRHDWVVDRCGTQVEYVIDFYAGKDEGKSGKSLNFFLDVRPKLTSFEGWRMRAMRTVGL